MSPSDIARPPVLDALAGQPLPEPLTTLGFHLVEADAAGARLTSWQGGHPARQRLMPGTHMVSHADLDDPGYPRIAAWLPEFAATGTDTDPWWTAWRRCSPSRPNSTRPIRGPSSATTGRRVTRHCRCWWQRFRWALARTVAASTR